MGRELKRVALDFDFELGETWTGYLNPHYKRCPACDGSGATEYLRRLNAWIGEMIYPLSYGGKGNKELQAFFRKICKEDEHTLLSLGSSGVFRVLRVLREAAGEPEGWGWCETCKGDGIDPSAKEAYEAWEPTQPPEGPGWQLWQTVSEGGPVSPVCQTAEELTEWMIADGYDPAGAKAFVHGPGWCTSMVAIPGKGIVVDGVTAEAYFEGK